MGSLTGRKIRLGHLQLFKAENNKNLLQYISPTAHILGFRVKESTSLVVIHHWKAEYLQISELFDNIAGFWY